MSPLRLDEVVTPGHRFLFGMLLLVSQTVLAVIVDATDAPPLLAQLAATLWLLLPPLVLARWLGVSVRDSFALRVPGGSQVFWSVVLGIGLVPSMAVLGALNSRWIAPHPEFIEAMEDFVPHGPTEWLVIAGLIAVLVPVAEELLFRGLLQDAAEAALGPVGSAVVVGLLFAAVHFQPWYLLPLAMIGVVLGYARLISGSVIACAIIHGIYNLGSLLLNRLAAAMEQEGATGADLLLFASAVVGAWAVWVALGRLGPADGPAWTPPPSPGEDPPD